MSSFLGEGATDQAVKAYDYRQREGLDQAVIPEKVMVAMASIRIIERVVERDTSSFDRSHMSLNFQAGYRRASAGCTRSHRRACRKHLSRPHDEVKFTVLHICFAQRRRRLCKATNHRAAAKLPAQVVEFRHGGPRITHLAITPLT